MSSITKVVLVFAILIVVTSVSIAWNSDTAIFLRAQSKYETILPPGTPKADIVSFFERDGDWFHDHPKNDISSLFRDENCPYRGHYKIEIDCQYSGFIVTSNPAGFLMEPYLYIYFVYDENETLVYHEMGVERTFL